MATVTLVNDPDRLADVQTQTVAQENVTIAAKSTGYIGLPSLTSKSGYTMVAAFADVAAMSNYQHLVVSTPQVSGSSVFFRVYNNGTTASTGTFSSRVRWVRTS